MSWLAAPAFPVPGGTAGPYPARSIRNGCCSSGSVMRAYLIEATNACQAPAVSVSVPPSRSVVSRTRIMRSWPTSTQLPPSLLEYVLFRQTRSTCPASSRQSSGIPTPDSIHPQA